MENYENEPVTLIISRKIIPDKQEDFEQWIDKILSAEANYVGYMGATIIRPSDPSKQEYSIILRFDSYSHLKKWEISQERKKFLDKVKKFEIKKSKQRVTGLEYWFTLPDAKTSLPPSPYKMMIATFIGIYPLSVLINYSLGPALGSYHILIRSFIVALILVILMTYMAMPLVTLLLKKWLYK
jgi:antibiotic biosynthesis monooxygenase (ABM) superfamily enzyme